MNRASFDRDTVEKAFRSDAFREQLGWGPREFYEALDAADGFDREFGTDTSGVDFETPPCNYAPVLVRMFREVMPQLEVDHSQFTFVDVGSGRGRGLLLASDYPFRRILGIELSEAHERAAQANLARYRSASQRCHHIESCCADALTYAYPTEDTVMWFFASFPVEAAKRFLEHVGRSLEAHPRKLAIVTTNTNAEAFLAAPYLRPRPPQSVAPKPPFISSNGVFAYATYANF